jgi:hypothetical protein
MSDTPCQQHNVRDCLLCVPDGEADASFLESLANLHGSTTVSSAEKPRPNGSAAHPFELSPRRLRDDAFSTALENEIRERLCNSCGKVYDLPAELTLTKTDSTGRPTRICKRCLAAKERR